MVLCHTLSVWYRVTKTQELVSRFLERYSKQMNLDEESVPRPLTTVCFYTDIPKEDLLTHFEEKVQVLSTEPDEKKVVGMGKKEYLPGDQFAGFYLKNGTFNIVKSISNTTITIYSSQSIQSRELCRVLEKVVFSQLEEKLKNLEQELEQLSTGQSFLGDNEIERRQIVEDLIGDIIALYNRSSIETILHPKIPELKLKTISDKVAQELFEVDKSIKGVGYRLSTMQIDIEEEQDEIKRDDKERAIRQYLSNAGIKNFEFHYVSPNETLFTHSAGSICFTNGETATLGCFANKKNNGDSKTLCALVARHFAVKSMENDFTVHLEGDVKLGTVIRSTINEEGYDIAAVIVDKKIEDVCKSKVRNTFGDFVPGNLYETITSDDDYKKLQNMEVYIWGTSKEKQPGYGKIIIPKYIRSDNPHPHVKVMDQDSSRRMAFPKDSGGIICIDSTEENAVTLIAMLKGSTENDKCIKANPGRKREYVTFLLRKGLEQLSQQTQCQFEIA